MQTKRNHAGGYWPNYREMAVDGLRLARKATSEYERERYVLATAFFVKRVLEMERFKETGATGIAAVEAILRGQQPTAEPRTILRRAS